MKNASPTALASSTAEWQSALKQIRQRRRRIQQLARVLGMESDSPQEFILREFLLGEIFRLAFEESRSPGAMLQELHQALKAVPVEASAKRKKAKNPVEQGREIRRRWRQLYGLDSPEEEHAESQQER